MFLIFVLEKKGKRNLWFKIILLFLNKVYIIEGKRIDLVRGVK